jgi:hypothetical protein
MRGMQFAAQWLHASSYPYPAPGYKAECCAGLPWPRKVHIDPPMVVLLMKVCALIVYGVIGVVSRLRR